MAIIYLEIPVMPAMVHARLVMEVTIGNVIPALVAIICLLIPVTILVRRIIGRIPQEMFAQLVTQPVKNALHQAPITVNLVIRVQVQTDS